MKVGFAGIGRMGEPMVLRLLGAGFPVVVWNRTPEKTSAVASAGAEVAESLGDLASRADVVLTMVTDDAAVEAVYAELLSGDVQGKIFAEMSTILPATVKRVADLAAEKGAAFVDAPVAGTVQPARVGKLLIFAGGDPSVVEKLSPVFAALARRVEYLGAVGSGAAMKLAHNTLLSTYWGVLAEALTMGVRYGLDLKRMLEVIGESPAAFAALPVKMPLLLGEPAEIGFNITNVRKDLKTIEAFAESLGVPIHIAEATIDNYEAALAAGLGGEDVGAIVKFHLGRI